MTIRVRPGAGRTAVGGRHDDSVVVRVRERAVDGKATDAALTALAAALDLRTRDIMLVSGQRSRTKTVEIPDESMPRFLGLRDS